MLLSRLLLPELNTPGIRKGTSPSLYENDLPAFVLEERSKEINQSLAFILVCFYLVSMPNHKNIHSISYETKMANLRPKTNLKYTSETVEYTLRLFF